ncbi:MAG: arginase family protein [Prolixibacteraceae bacterium]|nr:arginase family protein [Prolixibacteraceae bacterium]
MFKDKLTELLDYFDPVETSGFNEMAFVTSDSSLGKNLLVNNSANPLPVSSKFEVAIFSLPETHTIQQEGQSANAPQQIREQLYNLRNYHLGIKICDLGTIKKGNETKDTFFAVKTVCSLLFSMNVNIIIIGGNQYYTPAFIKAYKEFENNINIVDVNSSISINVNENDINSSSYFEHIINNDLSHIYNIISLGYQSYFVSPSQINRLNSLYFEHYRLGEIRTNPENCEPYFRDANLVNFDISAIRAQDAPSQQNGSPNGLFAHEACQLSRYAGISDNVQLFRLTGILPDDCPQKLSAKLAAQIIWYYLEGYSNRKHEYPKSSLDHCKKYEVQIDEIDFPIVFYKSEKTSRWWLEVKSDFENKKPQNSIVVSCTEQDYKDACKNEIPERWWVNFKKIKPFSSE